LCCRTEYLNPTPFSGRRRYADFFTGRRTAKRIDPPDRKSPGEKLKIFNEIFIRKPLRLYSDHIDITKAQ
jgi:hypothetical protein